jgi:hypothetical protein
VDPALVIGAYVRLIVATLSYLGPVPKGGGHERLARSCRRTRSWVGPVAGNLAAVAACAGLAPTVHAAAVAVWTAPPAPCSCSATEAQTRRGLLGESLGCPRRVPHHSDVDTRTAPTCMRVGDHRVALGARTGIARRLEFPRFSGHRGCGDRHHAAGDV